MQIVKMDVSNIAEMFVIGNLTDQSKIERNLFAEPFTELWKKLLGTIAFMLNSIGCVIMLMFVGLERQGFGSYYRTALNQINSWILIFVSQVFKLLTIAPIKLESYNLILVLSIYLHHKCCRCITSVAWTFQFKHM